jgi:hypothetical protein
MEVRPADREAAVCRWRVVERYSSICLHTPTARDLNLDSPVVQPKSQTRILFYAASHPSCSDYGIWRGRPSRLEMCSVIGHKSSESFAAREW